MLYQRICYHYANSIRIKLMRTRQILIWIAIIFSLGFVFILNRKEVITEPMANEDALRSDSEKRPDCVIPSLDPDASWIPRDFDPVSCDDKYEINPVYVDEGYVHVELGERALEIGCGYAPVNLLNDFNYQIAKNLTDLKVGTSECPTDVFLVVCKNLTDEHVIFKALLRCVYKKTTVMSRIIKASSSYSKTHFDERLNVIIFGLDSVSHISWREQMQSTTDYLLNNLGAVIFEGYNIVGDGTTPALLGLSTGCFEEELPEARRGFPDSQYVDKFPFIWRRLADEAGYVTLWDEDGSIVGTFQYRLNGFKRPPVDFYGRLFQMALEDMYPSDDCLGSISTFEEMIWQFHHLFDVYPDPIRKFAFVFNSHYSHTSLTAGGQQAYRVDGLLADELDLLNARGYLNESILILMTDHGSRFGGSRATQSGKLSERLPFLSIAMPDWWQNKYPTEMSHLRAATKRLTTPFDLHATLLEIGGLKPKPDTPRRGISFFSPIPLNRTCEDAGISPHWCTCLASNDSSSDVALDDPLIRKCLDEFESLVNKQLMVNQVQSGDCHPISAGRPFAARRMSIRREVAEFVESIDAHGRIPKFDEFAESKEEYIQISFRTMPGDGEFEVTFFHASDGSIKVHPKQISRTNKYGSAPKCIQDKHPHLRQYCYCKENQHKQS